MDLISRQETLYELSKLNSVGCIRVIEECLKVVEKIPSGYEGNWIPCSERMPKPGIEVLVTYESIKKTRYVGVAEMFSDYSFHGYDDEFLTPDGCKRKAVAWMPLPEPYKAESEEV